MKNKGIQNMKPAMLGLPSNVWSAPKDILISLSNKPYSVVIVVTDEKVEIVYLFVQLAQQNNFHQK
jgi:hypothetical protein